MPSLLFVSHPEVVVDPAVPVERWHLSDAGIARMRAFSNSALSGGVTAVWTSTETKAIEAAGILAAARGIGVRVSKKLGENDRSATGFLPPAEFEATADAFFAEPLVSTRGLERAIDAQTRIRAALAAIVADHPCGDLAVVSHGAVGTLLFCALTGRPIARSHDQPFQGHVWTASLPDLTVRTPWTQIAPRAEA